MISVANVSSHSKDLNFGAKSVTIINVETFFLNIIEPLVETLTFVETIFKVISKITYIVIGVVNISFKKKDQIVTMDTSNAIKICDEVLNIDPQLLFQRLVTAGTKNEQLLEVFGYELLSYPSAIFDMKNVLKAANKPHRRMPKAN